MIATYKIKVSLLFFTKDYLIRSVHHMKSDRSLLTTLILFIFFGWVSAHRFYAGKNFSAFIYLFTAQLCGLGLIIDFFLIITGNFTDVDGRKIL